MTKQTLWQDGSAVFHGSELRQGWGWLLALGIVWIVLGSIAIVVPLAAALALELVLGAVFAAGGIVQAVQAFRGGNDGGFVLQLYGALLAIILGLLLLVFPLQGVLTLTLLLSAFFVVEGAIKSLWAFERRSIPGWGWALFSGVLGIAVGLIIWFASPGSAAWVLGLLVGIDLIFSGWAMVMLALGVRRLAP